MAQNNKNNNKLNETTMSDIDKVIKSDPGTIRFSTSYNTDINNLNKESGDEFNNTQSLNINESETKASGRATSKNSKRKQIMIGDINQSKNRFKNKFKSIRLCDESIIDEVVTNNTSSNSSNLDESDIINDINDRNIVKNAFANKSINIDQTDEDRKFRRDSLNEIIRELSSKERMISQTSDLGDMTKIIKTIDSILVELGTDMVLALEQGLDNYNIDEKVMEVRTLINEIFDEAKGLTDIDQSLLFASARGTRNLILQMNTLYKGNAALLSNEDASRLYPLHNEINDEFFHYLNRDAVGDNSILPDITIIKPVFLLFVDDDLKKSLKEMKVSDSYIGLLKNVSVPTLINEEKFYADPAQNLIEDTGLFTVKEFEWSKQGVDQSCESVAIQTVKAYKERNEMFLKELRDYLALAKANNAVEISRSPDVAFVHVLTWWLNAAYAAIVERQFDIAGIIDKGIKTDFNRGLGINTMTFATKFLTSLQSSNTDGKTGYDSLIQVPLTLANNKYNGSLRNAKLYMSKYAYDEMTKAVIARTFIPEESDIEYYIGYNKVGTHRISVNVVPRVYLPLDITVTNAGYINVITANGEERVAIGDIFCYAHKTSRTIVKQDRKLSQSAYLMNISLFHMIYKVTAETYQSTVKAFFDTTSFSTESLRPQTLSKIFSNGKVSFKRSFSGISPFYNKSIHIRRTKAHDSTNSMYYQPGIDQAMQKPVYINDKGLITSARPFGLYDYIVSLFNNHGDYSWVESFIYLTQTFSGYCQLLPVDAKPLEGSKTVSCVNLTFMKSMSDKNMRVYDLIRENNMYQTNLKLNGTFNVPFESIKTKVEVDGALNKYISQDDIIRAFRYTTYHRKSNEPYLIDNFYKTLKDGCYFLPSIDNGELTTINVLLNDHQMYNIDKDFVMSAFKSSYANDGKLLISDNVNANKLTLRPTVIKNTNYVGFSGTSAMIDNFFSFDKTLAKKTLDVNKYVYISDDFFPTSIFYTVPVFSNTERGGDVAVQRSVPFEVILNATIRSGFIDKNIASCILALQAACGISTDYISAYTDLYREVDKVDGSEFRTSLDKTFLSTANGSETLLVPATAVLTGLPEFGDNATDIDMYSLTRSKQFYGYFKSIIPNGVKDYQTETDCKDRQYILPLSQKLPASKMSISDILLDINVLEILKLLNMEVNYGK